MGEKPWQDRETLQRLYWDRGLTLDKIADKYGLDKEAIRYWMEKHGIDRRSRIEHLERKPPRLFIDTRGYRRVICQHEGEQDSFRIHQLVAIAHGADPHKVFSNSEYNVHHKNGFKLDNRPSNLELMKMADHMRLHRG